MIEVPQHVQITLGYDRLFRSQILYEAIDLEGILDRIIAWHFCPDESKHGLFFDLVFRGGEIGFGKKITILRKLLRYSYPDLREAFRYLPKRLDALRELRNKFAHAQIVLPEEPPPAQSSEGVRLCYFKDGMQIEEFIERAEVDRQVAECRDLQITALMLEIIIRMRIRGEPDGEKEAAAKTLAAALLEKILASNRAD